MTRRVSSRQAILPTTAAVFARALGSLLATVMCSACLNTNGPIIRSPQCNAVVNRCMEQCGNGPSSQEPRNMASEKDGSLSQAGNTASSCEQSCANRC
jgi:hypothetical protein